MIRLTRAMIVGAVLLAPAAPALAEGARPEMSMDARKSFGCLAGGTAGTLAALSAGSENLVNLVAGGVVVPASSTVLTIGIVAVVFAGFCTVGEALTPALVYAVDHGAPVAARAGSTAMAAVGAGYDSMVSAARAGRSAFGEARMPDLAGAAEWISPATRRVGEGRAAIGAMTDAGWSAVGGLCLQSPACRARVVDAVGHEDAVPDLAIRSSWRLRDRFRTSAGWVPRVFSAHAPEPSQDEKSPGDP